MAIKSLYDIYSQKSGEFIENLLSKHVVIDDDIPSSFFAAKVGESGKWEFFKKNEQITYVERTVSTFYEKAIRCFESMPPEKIANVPRNLIFVMKYISNSAVDEMTSISEQILKLTHIIDDNTKQVTNDAKTLAYWAKFLNVGMPPIIFDGYLDDDQKAAILDFVYTNQEDLALRFKSESFTQYIINVLNPQYMSDGINSIVFRFTDDETNEDITAKIIDPLFYDMQKKNPKLKREKTNDLVYIIIMQLMNFIESYQVKDLISYVDGTKSPDMNYISVMNKIFTDYIKENYSDIMDMQFDVPPHILGKENDINFGFVGDQDVVNLINMNDSFKEVYRILINFFRKKRKKTNEFLNETMLKLFNSLVDKINKIISGKSLYEKYTPSFEEYVGLVSEDYSFNYMREGGIENQFAMHQRRKPVNIIVDYFQPINNTHISTSETLNKKNRLKTLFVLIDNKYQSDIRPFTTDKAEFLLKKYLSTNPEHVEGYVVVKKNNIEGILKSICEEYIPVLWAANKSRIEEYSIEMDYAKKHDTKFNVSKRFKLIISPNMENKRILDFIVTGNYQMFTQNTPKQIHSEFFELQKTLLKK